MGKQTTAAALKYSAQKAFASSTGSLLGRVPKKKAPKPTRRPPAEPFTDERRKTSRSRVTNEPSEAPNPVEPPVSRGKSQKIDEIEQSTRSSADPVEPLSTGIQLRHVPSSTGETTRREATEGSPFPVSAVRKTVETHEAYASPPENLCDWCAEPANEAHDKAARSLWEGNDHIIPSRTVLEGTSSDALELPPLPTEGNRYPSVSISSVPLARTVENSHFRVGGSQLEVVNSYVNPRVSRFSLISEAASSNAHGLVPSTTDNGPLPSVSDLLSVPGPALAIPNSQPAEGHDHEQAGTVNEAGIISTCFIGLAAKTAALYTGPCLLWFPRSIYSRRCLHLDRIMREWQGDFDNEWKIFLDRLLQELHYIASFGAVLST
ncbi:hypothetical protein AcW2_004196 [Taiwanofungus camphoratus]|nr:hypothetical protein AcW2_004196 [Antrodia cinnamomea]